MPNIYIDESGQSDILTPHHRFFLMTGVIIEDKEMFFAEKLLEHWKKKHSLSLAPGFHAYDLFETNENNANQLRTNRVFSTATNQLIDILRMVDIKAHCAVVDLKSLRKSLSVEQPLGKGDFSSKGEYKKYLKKYSEKFKLSHGEKKRQLPIKIALSHLLYSHKQELKNQNDENGSYINFESLSANDEKLVEIFHKLQSGEEDYPKYGSEIKGIQFHTKFSLSAGIEIADLIGYCTTQSLRGRYRLKDELKEIPIRSLVEARKLKKEINRFTNFKMFTKKPA